MLNVFIKCAGCRFINDCFNLKQYTYKYLSSNTANRHIIILGFVTSYINWSRISLWTKLISDELDITVLMIASQLSGHCDVIRNRLWRHQQYVNRASETRGLCVKTVILSSFMDSLCCVGSRIMYALTSWAVYALTRLRVLFWCLFPSLLCNLGINTKITLSWAHRQFATQIHTLFYIYPCADLR